MIVTSCKLCRLLFGGGVEEYVTVVGGAERLIGSSAMYQLVAWSLRIIIGLDVDSSLIPPSLEP